jgi:hypothetical protein
MIWCFLLSVLFNHSYDSQAIGATYATPDKSSATNIQMIGYMDNSNGQTNRLNEDIQPSDNDLIMHNGGTIYYEHLTTSSSLVAKLTTWQSGLEVRITVVFLSAYH